MNNDELLLILNQIRPEHPLIRDYKTNVFTTDQSVTQSGISG